MLIILWCNRKKTVRCTVFFMWYSIQSFIVGELYMWIRISKLLLTIKNIALVGVGISLCIALINTLINLGYVTWANIQGYSTYSLLIEELITFFLYFEFIALIVKYFKNNFHFPLNFFLYIGITAIVRLLITDHESSFDNLIWSVAILVLVCSLVLVEKFIGHNE